jgi:hypothetical protein
MRDAKDAAHLEGLARLSKELGRLDPYSFWVVPAGSLSNAGDLIVAGSTGLFLMAAWPAPGAFSVSRGRPMVDDRAIPAVRALRSDAKRLSAKLSASSVSATVEPVICLTHGVAGMPRDVKGVHVVALGALVKYLASRTRILEHSRVERAARVLGVQIAGDRKRHFA